MTLTKFRGAEIQTEIVKAIEAIPAAREIVTFKAAENSPITAVLAPQDVAVTDWFIEYSWNGEQWLEVGYA